ncbi:MAG: hypothetical protein LIR46_08090 [Bacteroidota bacterium]|nr:hypothetical protein [Bacteroidota bacterium]
MTREEAIKTLKENYCAMCSYGLQDMDSCDIRSCDNKDAIKTLEQELTTKNDLEVDCIPRIEVIDYLCKHCPDDGECFKDCDEIKHLRNIPSVTPQESTTKNDLEVDCISRKAVERIINKWLSHSDYELKDHIYSMTEKIHNLPSVTPQEPFINKPCVSEKQCEHDKNVILDKIREEVESIEHYGTNDGNDFWLRTPDEIKKDVLAILDKYKTESEDK